LIVHSISPGFEDPIFREKFSLPVTYAKELVARFDKKQSSYCRAYFLRPSAKHRDLVLIVSENLLFFSFRIKRIRKC